MIALAPTFSDARTRRATAKLLLIFVAIALRAPMLAYRLEQVSSSAELAMLIALFLFFAALLVVAAFLRNTWLRWCLALLFAAGTVPILAYEQVSAVPMGYFQFITFVDASSAAGDALFMFPQSALVSGVGGLAMLFGIALTPHPLLGLAKRWSALAIAGVCGIIALIIVRSGGGMSGVPAAWAGVGYGALYISDRISGQAGPRDPVTIDRTQPADPRDLVYIIDESIAGHYLDINSPTGVRSGLANLAPTIAMHNFGLAASISNCSMSTNVVLRYGGTRDRYGAILATSPSIWSYAEKAGYRTIYLYGQRGGANENYMTDAERAGIDRAHYFDELADLDRDQAIASLIAKYSRDGRRDFILVNKFGAHFPVHEGFPETHATYAPMLPRALRWKKDDDSDANRRNVVGGATDWQLYRNSYRNTVTWTVGAFFDRLVAEADMRRILLIYTSDHGQTFHERGTAGLATHCYPQPVVEEYIVPLVVLENGSQSGATWRKAALMNRDRTSQFRIFPSLLLHMGYDPQRVIATYGQPLSSRLPDPMTGAANMYLNFTGSTSWIKIDPSQVIHPPAQDIAPVAAR